MFHWIMAILTNIVLIIYKAVKLGNLFLNMIAYHLYL